MSPVFPLVLGFGEAPSSNGAHMLAWWLAAAPDRWERFERALSSRAGWLEDLLSGVVTPHGEMADSIAGYTQGAVPAEQWDCGCCLDWQDKPLGMAGPPGRFAACAPAEAR